MLTRKPSAGACVGLALPAALFVGAGACAKSPPPSLPATGTVTVGITSRGPGVETMAFGVSIEPGGITGAVKGDVGIFTARSVPPGNHIVRMKDLPRQCQVEGAAEQTVRVAPGRSIAVRFVITCT